MARRYHNEDDEGGGILDWLWVFLLVPGILFLIILVERKRAENERRAASLHAGLEPEVQLEGSAAARESSHFQSATYRSSAPSAEEEAGAAAPVDPGAAAAAAAEAASSTVESEAQIGAQVARQSGAVVNHPSQDELEAIEGIGPKIASILRAQGIHTFRQLSETSLDRLNEILQEVGAGINPPDTWPEQALLAAEGKWDEFEELKRQLKAGRRNGS